MPFAFTLLFVMSIFITSGYLLQSVTEEKENRVVEILLSSVPSLPLMAGKILGLGAAGLTQVAIWVAASRWSLHPASSARRSADLATCTSRPPSWCSLSCYFVLGYLAYGAIFAAIGAVAPGNREAQQYSGFFGFVAVIPLIFSSVFLSGDLDSPLVWALALIPFTAPATMLMVLTVAPTIPVAMVVASLLSLTLFVALATIASARVFRATLLLYGVRPEPAPDRGRDARPRSAPIGQPAPGVDPSRAARVGRQAAQAAVRRASTRRRSRGPQSLSLNQVALRTVKPAHSAGTRVLGVDRVHGALGLAGAAVDALIRVDDEHPVGALVEVDAVDRTDRHAGLVQDVDARLGDDVGHSHPPLDDRPDGAAGNAGWAGSRTPSARIAARPYYCAGTRCATGLASTGRSSTRPIMPLLDVARQVTQQQQLPDSGHPVSRRSSLWPEAEPDPQRRPCPAGRSRVARSANGAGGVAAASARRPGRLDSSVAQHQLVRGQARV